MNADNRIRFHLTVVGVFAAAMLAIVILMTMNQASAVVIGDNYSGYGDWVITQPTTVIDETIFVLDGDIILRDDMRVWNSNIYLEPMMVMDYGTIDVPAGRTLQSNDTTFESMMAYFNLDVKGRLVCDNVDFNWLNWTSISGSAQCNDTHFYYVIAGLQMDGNILWTNGTIQYVFGGFNVTSNALFYNSRLDYASPGMIVSGNVRFSFCTIEDQMNTMTWSGTVTEDNSSIRYVYEFNITGTTTFMDTYMYRIYEGMNMPGTVSITNGDLNYVYAFNASGTVTVYNTTHYRMTR